MFIIFVGQCPQSRIDHGTVIVLNGYSVGSTIEYLCDRNYELIGNNTRNCQEDGTWSGRTPICKRTVFI